MGIKGIYNEIGPGQRISLSKLAVEKLEQTGRPLRVAIDISIWQFQIQSGRGGTNPALRTLYYRLIRLLSLGIQPLFVFDGPHKPPFKRNKQTFPHATSVDNHMTKDLLDLFGFPYHLALGEAEAECALLQKEGIVDAVLSEDVDTLMFGSGVTLRNWSSEGTRGTKQPTHVNLYDAKVTKDGESGLDQHGMVLVALMSGGDYIPEGIPGCGIKVACQAARAGFGTDLCKLSPDDKLGLRSWKERLEYELRTNESGFFRNRHRALKVPTGFPNKEALGYYVRPVVSSADKIEKLRTEIKWRKDVNVLGLRIFTARAFDWNFRSGAKKFIRGLAPALLVQKLLTNEEVADSPEEREILEAKLVDSISGFRKHISTDGLPENRLTYIPLKIVQLDLEKEEDDGEHEVADARPTLITSSSDEGDIENVPNTPRKTRKPPLYDPTLPAKIWVLGTFVKLGVPLMIEDWEASRRIAKKPPEKKAARSKSSNTSVMKQGALDRYVKIKKTYVAPIDQEKVSKPDTIENLTTLSQTAIPRSSQAGSVRPSEKGIAPSTPRAQRSRASTHKEPTSNEVNPWTIAANSKTERRRRRRAAAHELPLHEDDPFGVITISSSPSIADAVQEEASPRRRLRFTSPGRHHEPSSPNSLPSPSALTRPATKVHGESIFIPSSPPPSPSPRRTRISPKKSTGQKIILRESLQGTWRHVEEWEVVGNREVIEGVEVLDLTAC